MIETVLPEIFPLAVTIGDIAVELRYLAKKDLPDIMAIQEIVVQRLSRKELLEAISAEFMEAHFGAKGFIIGAFVKGQLIAFCSGYFPDPDEQEWNLGYDIALESPEELKKVANLQLICIHPDYRGYALGRRMATAVIETIRGYHRYQYVCATASPYNYWSVNILLNCGLTVRKMKLKYGGKLRYIAYMNLRQPSFALKMPQDPIAVRLTDIERQALLLEQGFIGVRIREIAGFYPQTRIEYADGFEILFAKPDLG